MRKIKGLSSCLFILVFVSSISYARVSATDTAKTKKPTIISAYNMQVYNRQIKRIYKTALERKFATMAQRVAAASAVFLGKPYVLGPLGEGIYAKFDQQPLYRTNEFDCTTYVSTILALVEAKNFKQFQKTIRKVRYKNAKVSYVNRNHFISVDWNINNQNNGYLKDITKRFPGYKMVTTVINKPGWYQKKAINNLQLLHPISVKQAQKLLAQFRAVANKVKVVTSHFDYLPLSALFSKDGKPNQKLFNKIPSGSVIEIVRPNWNLKKLIGTNLNISHMGLAVRTPKGLMYREASSNSKIGHHVLDTSLEKYLLRYYKLGPKTTVKGIHIEKIL